MIQKKPLSPEAAKSRLVALCNSAEQCSGDILNKLKRWGVSARDSREILASLIDLRLVDDRRFSEIYARHKLQYSGSGRRKIAAGLYGKHIDKEYIDSAVELLDPDLYHRILLKVMEAAARKQPDRSYQSKMKILRHAVARGFEAGLAVEILKSGELWTSSED